MTSQGTMSLGHSWGSRSTESRFVLPGTTRASLNGEDARANQRGAEVELVAAQGDADRADIDAAAAQTELDMAQQAASDADAAVATVRQSLTRLLSAPLSLRTPPHRLPRLPRTKPLPIPRAMLRRRP